MKKALKRILKALSVIFIALPLTATFVGFILDLIGVIIFDKSIGYIYMDWLES